LLLDGNWFRVEVEALRKECHVLLKLSEFYAYKNWRIGPNRPLPTTYPYNRQERYAVL